MQALFPSGPVVYVQAFAAEQVFEHLGAWGGCSACKLSRASRQNVLKTCCSMS